MVLHYLIYIATGYFMGGVLFSWILPKWLRGIDVVQQSDDRNPGTANAMKYGGAALGVLCLALDLAKGYLPVHMALSHLDPANVLFAVIIAAPVLGHAFSPMMRLRGGKAIATLFGVLIALLPVIPSALVLAILLIFFATTVVVKTNAYCVAAAMTLLIFDTLMFRPMTPVAIGVIIAAAIVMIKHIPTLRRQTCSVHPPLVLTLGRGRQLAKKKPLSK